MAESHHPSIRSLTGSSSIPLSPVPVAGDGSFFVEVPADTPLRFELLDSNGRILVHETEFTSVRGGETLGCVGCHEQKRSSPSNKIPEAMKRPPFVLGPKKGAPVYMGRLDRSYNLIVRE